MQKACQSCPEIRAAKKKGWNLHVNANVVELVVCHGSDDGVMVMREGASARGMINSTRKEGEAAIFNQDSEMADNPNLLPHRPQYSTTEELPHPTLVGVTAYKWWEEQVCRAKRRNSPRRVLKLLGRNIFHDCKRSFRVAHRGYYPMLNELWTLNEATPRIDKWPCHISPPRFTQLERFWPRNPLLRVA